MNRLNEEEKPQQNVRKAQERQRRFFGVKSRRRGFLGVALFFFPSFSSFRKILWREVSYIAMAKVSLS